MAALLPQDLLTPENLRSVKGLLLLARATVNSQLPGLQRSEQLGAGQEFSQYRSYQPGDDLRRLDWKLFARSDRYYVREASIESNMTVSFVLDSSASMLHEDNGITKLDYARYLVSTLAWLAVQSGDNIGLQAINEGALVQLPARPGRNFLQRFCYELVKIDGKGAFPRQLAQQYVPKASTKRELLIFVTDCYQSNDEINKALTQFNQGRREVLLFHLMGQNELELNFKGARTFIDLETNQRIQVDSPSIKKQYLGQLAQHLKRIRQEALRQGISYQLFRMDEGIGDALKMFLKRRQASLTQL
ncbi:MAG: DUF58 domain-containing protein [Bacteroidota bacterium]